MFIVDGAMQDLSAANLEFAVRSNSRLSQIKFGLNNKYKIKETHNVSEASSFEDRKIKSGLKTSTLRNNKSMNNKYRITIQDTPVQNTSRSTCLFVEIKSGLMESAFSNNKTMNNKYKIKETHNVSESSSFEDRKIKSGLMESTLSNNKTMNNDYRTTIMDVEHPAHAQVVMSAKY